MTEARLEVVTARRTGSLRLGDGSFTFGGVEGVDLKVPELEGYALRVGPDAEDPAAYVLEVLAAPPAASLEAGTSQVLRAGAGVARVGDVRLRYRPAEEAAPVARREGRESRTARFDELPPLLKMSLLLSGSVLVLLLLFVVSKQLFRRPGTDHLRIAERQLAAGDIEKARASIEAAVDQGVPSDQRKRLNELETRITAVIQARRDAARLSAAHEHAGRVDAIRRVVEKEDTTDRARARVLVTEIDDWLDEFSDLAAAHEEMAITAKRLREQRAELAGVAELGAPADYADTHLAARLALRLRPPRYPRAREVLQAFLASAPAGEERDLADAMLDDVQRAGDAWMRAELRSIQKAIDADDLGLALGQIDRLENGRLFDEYGDELRRLKAAVERARSGG